MTQIKGYEVVYEQGEDGGWGGYFPDGPTVYAAADSREEIQRLMEEGLDIWLEETAKDAAARQNGATAA
jgi:predicted RNase H-like HicB family nuclease